MDPKLIAILIAACSLQANATEDQARTALAGLDETKRDAIALTYGPGGKDVVTAFLAKKPAPAPVTAPAATDDDADEQFVMLEQKRVTNITKLADLTCLGMAENVQKAVREAATLAVSKNMNLGQARQEIQAALGKTLAPVSGTLDTATVHVGNDNNLASLQAAIPQALAMRWNPDVVTGDKLDAFEKHEARDRKPDFTQVRHGRLHERAHELKHMSLKEMFRDYLIALGVPAERYSDVQLARAMGKRGLRAALGNKAYLAESTNDFASITLDAMNKSTRFFYLDAPRTWDKWCQRVTNPDFKNRNAIVLSETPNLTKRKEGGGVNYLVLKDGKEAYAVEEYIGGIKLTRMAMINDDKNVFSQIPRLLSMSAVRLEDDTAYGLLLGGLSTSAPFAMSDGYAVFDDTNHSNYISSGTAISVSSLQTGKTKMKKQKGLNNAAYLELEPKFLICPTDIEDGARQLLTSEILLAAQGTSGSIPVTVGSKNPFVGRYEVIGSSRLSGGITLSDGTTLAGSTTSWYLVHDYREGRCNTAEIMFLEDEPEPVIRQETDFDTEDVKFAERHTVAAKIIDHRGFVKNAGA